MIERALAVANRQAVEQRCSHVLLGFSSAFPNRSAQCQIGREGGGERAAAAMRGVGVHAWPGKLITAGSIDQHVDRIRFVQVAALHDHGPSSERQDTFGREARIARGHNRHLRQHRRFSSVGCDNGRKAHEVGPQHCDRITREERLAARSQHDWIQHNALQRPPLNPCHHGSHDVNGREHPEFRRVDLNVLGDGIDLRSDGFGRYGKDGTNAYCVLRGDRGDDRCPVDAARGERLEVGLQPGAPARIAAGDGQDSCHGLVSISQRSANTGTAETIPA